VVLSSLGGGSPGRGEWWGGGGDFNGCRVGIPGRG